MTKKKYSDFTEQEKKEIKIGRELRERLEKERDEEIRDELLHPKTFIDRLIGLTKVLLIGFVVFSVLFTIITLFF